MKTNSTPYIFDEFFSSGKEDTISPFLTPDSRKIGKNLKLKSSLLAAIFLLAALITSFYSPQISYLFLAFVYFLAGIPALIESIEDISNLEINIDVLMTLAALLSVLIGSALEGGLLLVLFELSAGLEGMVTQKTKTALTQLNKITPRTAFVLEEDHSVSEKALHEVTVGMHILVKAGEVIPLDGNVIEGSSFINLVHLTGESKPVPTKPGDEVAAGGRNLDGKLVVRVERTSNDSTLSRIIELITKAHESKPRMQRLFDRFGKYYATTIILLSAAFALLLPFIFSIEYLGDNGSIYRALAFLIAASPCALIIATPTAYLSAISSCAKKGILLKGGVTLDSLASCSIVAFDKTGTLTTGELNCTQIAPLWPKNPSISIDQALSIAAGLERGAVHPIAKAIENFAKEKKISASPIENFNAKAGFGLEGEISIDGTKKHVAIGHAEYILSLWKGENHRDVSDLLAKSTELSTLLLIDEELFLFDFLDTLRPDSGRVLQSLRDRHRLQLIMLTGDRQDIAEKVASNLAIDQIFSELRPEDKLNKVIELNRSGELVMVGDGVNDAPALARSTVGISMGKIGSATAVEASDIVFIHDDFSLLNWLMDKAHSTMRIVKQNISLALVVIFFATTPALLGLIPLWLAVILHEGGTVIVGLNSLRLLKR